MINNVEEKKEYVAPQMTVVDMNDNSYILCCSDGGIGCDTDVVDDVVGD